MMIGVKTPQQVRQYLPGLRPIINSVSRHIRSTPVVRVYRKKKGGLLMEIFFRAATLRKKYYIFTVNPANGNHFQNGQYKYNERCTEKVHQIQNKLATLFNRIGEHRTRFT